MTQFPTDIEGLPASIPSEVVELSDADEFELRIAAVTKQLGDATVRMLAYNGSIPGPTLRVRQGSEVVVHVVNDGDLEATVHWHGLRVDNRYDGTHETQAPIPIGGSFTYRVQFPDPGLYWYHPHIREDYGQELGLYGNILVVPADPDYWAPVNREVVLTLDDILLEDGKIAPFSREETNYVAMGRFGNILLVAGEPELELSARLGEVVRFYLTNTANTRVFNVALPGARMKLVGGDSGRYEHEQLVDEVLLAPSERAVVDVLFDTPGPVTLEHNTPDRRYPLAAINVAKDEAEPSLTEQFDVMRSNADMVAERDRITPYLAAAPDKTLAFVAEMDMGVPEGPVVYTCPMHPEVVSVEEGSCPRCGMKLLAAAITYACPMHPEVVSQTPDRCPECGMKLLPSQSSPRRVDHPATHEHDGAGPRPRGRRRDRVGGRHGRGQPDHDAGQHALEARRPGDRRREPGDRLAVPGRRPGEDPARQRDGLRPSDAPSVPHPRRRPVPRPSRDGVDEPNLVWKDTVLVRTGETVDILLDVTNPGVWMAHCHIAEHHESGMMFSFHVDA